MKYIRIILFSMFFPIKTYSFISSLNLIKLKYNCYNITLNKLRSGYISFNELYKKKKKNYALFSKKINKMDIKKTETVEKLIERYNQEISTLIERNESIRNISDEELQREYENNEKLLEEKKKKLNDLYIVPSEPLKLIENRSKLENLIKRKFFYTNAFEIYGGTSGLIDYGPSGCLLKSELEKLWRYHFIYYDEMLEISSTCVTPYNVLKTSGHVDRFTDLMVRDSVTKDCYRADKYLSEFLNNKIEELKKKVQEQNEVQNKKEKKNLGNEESNVIYEKEEIVKEIEDIELIIRKLDGMNPEEIKEVIKKYDIKSPAKNNLSDPFPFNLMFQTKIGPKDEIESNVNEKKKNNEKDMNLSSIAYLRPETAQGIFVNFRKLLEYNGGKMPFAGAQIGLGFRNEISPRNGLLRVREFQMAEIEYFVNPNKKFHEKYYLFKHLMLPLFPRDNQLTSKLIIKNLTIQEAVEQKIIGNEALAYFLARTYLFLLKCGINKDGIRFRQHLKTEMAHYASDCWDAEILTSYGYIEVVGHADRSAYDLKSHMESTDSNLYACEKYNEPIEVEYVKVFPNKAKIGSKFRNDQNIIYKALNEKSNEDLLNIDEELNKNNKYILKVCNGPTSVLSFELTRDMVTFQKCTKKVQEENFIPNVIEPSFGIGRLIFCILEHSFRIRSFTDDKEERNYLSLPYKLAPIKCSILSISNNKAFYPHIKQIQMLLNEFDISSKIDNSSVSIGKKYARTDEIGIPFAVTIDFQTLKDRTITLRERDSMLQIRIDINSIVEIINSLIHQKKTWNDYISNYGLFTQQNL
ncbi:glycine--tRNA ligase, putative [Plasmodium relictum]|uniref:glycine--tRNA ligase n=1 Tax=Plasmodium relictum TaxID=85471 RepID=A0A1J1HHJ6_PLARL|nr:glycine--tRNA ligase, putative [Plasmodium relictum]CRH03938.1 glycine--tRNA ligase, putative [Plasmodium relictum]